MTADERDAYRELKRRRSRPLAAKAREVVVAEGTWGDRDSWPLEVRTYLYGPFYVVASNRLALLEGSRVQIVIREAASEEK